MNVLEVCSSMGNERDPLHQQLLLMLPLLELQLLVRTRGMVCLVCRCYVVTKGTRGSRLLSLLVLLLLAVFSRGLATGYWPGPNNHAGTNTGQQKRVLRGLTDQSDKHSSLDFRGQAEVLYYCCSETEEIRTTDC